MNEHDESSGCSDKSLPCYSVDEQILQILWEEDINMNQLLEFSFDHIEELAKKHGKEVSEAQKQDVWDYVQRMRAEKSDWLSPSEIPTPRRTNHFWDTSIGPPPPTPVFGLASAVPMTSSPKALSPPAASAAQARYLGPGFSTPQSSILGDRLGPGLWSSERTSFMKTPASASAVLALSPGAAPSTSGLGVFPDDRRQQLCRRRSLGSLRLCPSAELSPVGTNLARASKRGIGQRLKSFFRSTVSWKVPQDQGLTKQRIASIVEMPSPVFRFHSSSRLGLMRERMPTFIRKSLRRRSGRYSMNARRHQK